MKTAPNSKYQDIVTSLRSDIVCGVYAPGNRLPTRAEMVEEYGASVVTVQRALNALLDEGFIRARARAGTFVVDNPPHLSNYAMVFYAEGQWSRFYMALREATRQLEAGEDMWFREYDVSTETRSRGEVARLYRDISSRTLAGLIFAGPTQQIESDVIVKRTNIPRVFLHLDTEYGVPGVAPDPELFLDRALEYLHARGRRRIAHILLDYPLVKLDAFEAGLRQRGVDVRPYWTQPIPSSSVFRGASRVVNLLMHLEGDRRPDAIIIHDDNLIEHCVEGIIGVGASVPEDLEVVAKSNFPAPVHTTLPIKLLGADFRIVLKESLRVMEMQRRGETPPDKTPIPSVFEEEIQ